MLEAYIVCQKAGKYINVLSRMSNALTTEAKLLFKSFISHFVFSDFQASYSDLRYRDGRPFLYTELLKAILTEFFQTFEKYLSF